MKIIHLCLANFYIDNYSYQENILPKVHSKMGYDVTIIASTETFNKKKQLAYVKPCEYMNEYNLKVHRIQYRKILPRIIMKKLRMYVGLKALLNKISPDIIFIHDVQFLDSYIVYKYVKKHKQVKVFADCHADFSNSARTFASYYILHKLVYKFCAKILENIVVRFWGVLPSRVEFLNKVYGIPLEKIGLLRMGAENEYMNLKIENSAITKSFFLSSDKVRIITGGKIDSFKLQTLRLISLIGSYNKEFELVVFGSVDGDIKVSFDAAVQNSSNVRYVGWLSVYDTYNIISQADIGIFPGRHSTLWEQCVALGLPLVIKKWHGHEHLDIGGNIYELIGDNDYELIRAINYISNMSNLDALRRNALNAGRFDFSYDTISMKSLCID